MERNRAELRRMIGAVEKFLPPEPQSKQIGSTPAFTFSLVEWPVLRLGNIGATMEADADPPPRLSGVCAGVCRPGQNLRRHGP